MPKAIVEKDHWEKALGKARTKRANQDVPEWGAPPYEDVVNQVEYVQEITPAPDPYLIKDAFGGHAEVELAWDGKMIAVRVAGGRCEVEGEALVRGEYYQSARALKRIAEELGFQFVPDDGTA